MYLQIMGQIKHLVANGEWQQGEKVPSIRELAVASQVSVITVKRAYQELEREGVLVTQHGVGSFVAKKDDLGDQIMQSEIDKYLKDAITYANSYGVPLTELVDRLKYLSKLENGEENE